MAYGLADQKAQDGQAGDQQQCSRSRIASYPFAEAFGRRDGPGSDWFLPKPAFQIVRERFGRAIATLRIFLKALEADRFQIAIDRSIECAGPARFLFDGALHCRQRRLAFEGWLARE